MDSVATGSRDRTVRARRVTAILALALGTAVAFGLGVYARVHGATGHAPLTLGFALPGQMKEWLTRAAIVLACFQLASGLRINGHIRVPRRIPGWLRTAHRTSGGLAILLAALVAFDCVSAFGFQATSARIVVHGIAGVLPFGAFAAKVVTVRRRRRPPWLIPAAGTTLFVTLAVLWLTSIGWPVSIY